MHSNEIWCETTNDWLSYEHEIWCQVDSSNWIFRFGNGHYNFKATKLQFAEIPLNWLSSEN